MEYVDVGKKNMSLTNHIEQRLGFFHRHGYIETLPTSWQVRIGTLAMLPVSLSESDRERERSRQTWLGQVPIRVPLQVAYCPAQFFADSGLTMKPKNIVKSISKAINLGQVQSSLASQGKDWEGVIDCLMGWHGDG